MLVKVTKKVLKTQKKRPNFGRFFYVQISANP